MNDSVAVVTATAPRATSQGLDELARFVYEIELEDLPAPVLARGREVIVDLIGVIAAGMREPEMHKLAAQLAPSNATGRCTLIGCAAPVQPSAAALLHGTAGTFLELDEGNRFSRGHPGIHVFPAAFAVAQRYGITGARLLTAFIAGYEVAARIGAASEIRPVMHPHGTWGTVGAAVAVRKLLGGTVADFARTINIASTLGLATSVKTMREGGTVRNAFAGVTGTMSLLVNELVDAGFTGESDGLSSVFDGVTAHAFRWERMLEGLGQRWEIQRNYFKTHACCRFNHAALDALAVALKAHLEPLVVDEIESIEVHTYSLAAMLVNPQPVNALAAKYSLPFAIATALVHESTGVAAFASEAVGNPVVRRLAQRVRVHEDPAMTKLLPELRQARVVVRLLSGQQFAGFVHTNRGDSDDPLGEEELSRKFIDLARGTWTPVEADGLRRRLLGLDSVSDVSALFDRLSEES